MSTPPPVWQPAPAPWASRATPADPSPLALWGARAAAALVTALWGLVASLAVVVVVAPLAAPLLVHLFFDPRVPLTSAQAVGVSVVLASPARLAAGAVGAALLSVCRATSLRVQAVPVVAVGALGSRLLYVLVLVHAAGSPEAAFQDDGPLRELPRWVVEAALGALLVPVRRGPRARAGRRRTSWGDRGAATVEYAGVLTVAVTLVLALVLAATGIGQKIAQVICTALELSCSAPPDRVGLLDPPCVLSAVTRLNAGHLVADLVRLGADDADTIEIGADGTAVTSVAQDGELGVEADAERTRVGAGGHGSYGTEAGAHAEAYGGVALLTSFPTELGGEEAAKEQLRSQRGVLGQVVDSTVTGAPLLREQWAQTQYDVTQDWYDVRAFFGDGPTAQERAETDRRHQAETADAIQFTAGVRGEAEAGASAGVAEVEASAAADVHGTVTVSLHDGGPDHIPSSFTGELSGDVLGSAETVDDVDGMPLPVSAGASAGAGGKVQYTVENGADGAPAKLVWTTERTLSAEAHAGLASPTGIDGVEVDAGAPEVSAGGAKTVVTTQILDLADPQDRAAFDALFVTAGGETQGYQYTVSVPRLDALAHGGQLQQRLDRDALVTEATFVDDDSVGDDDVSIDLALPGFGGGAEHTTTGTRLVGMTVHDNRYGESPHAAAFCSP